VAGERATRAADVGELLTSCDPIDREALTGAEIEEVLDAIGASLSRQPFRRQHTVGAVARRRIAVALVAAAVAVSAGIAAAGVIFTAHTGRVVPKAEEPMGGPGEELNPAAPDFRTVALQVGADIPYPEGYAAWRELVVSDASDPSGLVSSGALHGWFAASAFCAWVLSWRQSVVSGDANATGHAAQTIAQAPRWKAVTDEDPHPDPSAANDPGAETGTLFGWMLPYRDAVLAGNRAKVEQLLAGGYGDGKCWSSDPDWRAQLARHRDWRTLSPSAVAQKYERFLDGERP
jgi:hypothetical protein